MGTGKALLSILILLGIGFVAAFILIIYILPNIFPNAAMTTAREEKAYYLRGNAYYNGKGVLKNYTKANYWYLKSAEQGYAPAQYSLGLDYRFGQGVPQDYAKSYYWMWKAAKQGYINGWGVPKDYAKSYYWRWKAAEQGYVKGIKLQNKTKRVKSTATGSKPAA